MKEAKRLSSLVNDMLDMSSLKSGIANLNKSHYNLTESLKATVDRINELVKKDGYMLTFDYDKDTYIYADEVKSTQAFKNHKRPLMVTGLGLTMVKKLIEVHGDKYGVKSKHGKGSVFWFQLEIKK